MKKTFENIVKFHTEKKDSKQIQLAHKELDKFMEIFEDFHFYFSLNFNKLDETFFINRIDEELM
jgi:hypothetical protein